MELAGKLGVTDRSVSNWENGICLPDASSKEISFDDFHNSLKRISEIAVLLQRFDSKQDAVSYLVKGSGLSIEECGTAYDYYMKMFDNKLL